jgi:hypothetical protein
MKADPSLTQYEEEMRKWRDWEETDQDAKDESEFIEAINNLPKRTPLGERLANWVFAILVAAGLVWFYYEFLKGMTK